jgi:hypothetical protein
MVNFYEKIFHNYVSGTQSFYTDTRYADMLGTVERLSITGSVGGITGTSPTLTIQLENSPDLTHWQSQSVTPEIANIPIGPGTYTMAFDSELDVPFAAFVRLRITLGGTSPGGLVTIFACGRSPAG